MSTAITPVQIARGEKVRDVKISPRGDQVLYQVEPFYKAKTLPVSTLWLGKTSSTSDTARRLTDGKHDDRVGVWHPDGERVLFLSDRNDPKNFGSKQIFSIQPKDHSGPEGIPVPVLLDLGTSVQSFEISPDGSTIAFSVERVESQHKEVGKDARVIGEKTRLSRLALYHYSTGTTSYLNEVRPDMHVEAYTWSPDSKFLLYRLSQGREAEYVQFETILEKISLESREIWQIGKYPRAPSGPNLWLGSEHIAVLQNFEPDALLDARTFFSHSSESSEEGTTLRMLDASNCSRLYGEKEDVIRMVKADANTIAVEIASEGVDTYIDVLAFDSETSSYKTVATVFRTDGNAIWFGAWDCKRITNPEREAVYVVAPVLSSGFRHQPPNVWTRVIAESELFNFLPEMSMISSHLKWITNSPVIRCEVFTWTADDGVRLNGMIRYPHTSATQRADELGRLPTILFLHGGPYRRSVPDLCPYFCQWAEFLASMGYLVLSPNYRGSQGRGHEFAFAANLGVGEKDWGDCEGMVNEMIKKGLADPERLGVGGWSHGGSLTAYGVCATKNKFKAAVVGAGASNWETMVTESSSPELEIAIGQRSPWRRIRRDSPIHLVGGVSTAVLILHGERDQRVPIGQAFGLFRGLKREGKNNHVEMIAYPREPHGFKEEAHAEDVLDRVGRFFNDYCVY